jgi:hypothetical protein
MNHYRNQDLKTSFKNLGEGFIAEKNRQQDEENKRVHEDFISNLQKGKCFLCGMNMNSFKDSVHCFHWFTYPKGIRKKHFESYLKKPLGFFQLDSYFRWLANSEVFLTNINDLKVETSATSYLESTFRYKNIEWAFSVGNTDLEGHTAAKVGAEPHFHIQMKINNQIFLRFNDFHIPFSDQDLFMIELRKQMGDELIINQGSLNAGIAVLENEELFKELEKEMIRSDDETTAPFNRQSIIIAPEGQTISGEIMQQAFDESSRTKEPVSKVIQRLIKDIKVITQIVPGDAVPEMTKRSGKK